MSTPSSAPFADAVVVKGLDFRFNHKSPYVFRDLHLRVPSGARCLIVGDNGAGKSTLLRVLGGKHMYVTHVPLAVVAQTWRDV